MELARWFLEEQQPQQEKDSVVVPNQPPQQRQQQRRRRRLEIIGALEEGILTIEKTVFQGGRGGGGQREDPPRDRAPSKLYTAYGRALSELDPNECLQLALYPHTLLIGAETVVANNKKRNNNNNDDDKCGTAVQLYLS
jgi:hypothetical protein